MKFPPDYPYSPPSIRFLTKVWHPNVYEVIFSRLKEVDDDDWLVGWGHMPVCQRVRLCWRTPLTVTLIIIIRHNFVQRPRALWLWRLFLGRVDIYEY